MRAGIGGMSGSLARVRKGGRMDYRHRYQVIVLTYQYLVVMYLFLTAVVATGVWFRSLLFFAIALAVGYLVVRFRLKYYIEKEENETKERQCHLFVAVIALIVSFLYLAQMEEYQGEGTDTVGIVLLCVQIFSVIASYLYAGYFHEKYLTMYANPSVSEETIRRFEQNTWRALRKKAMVFGGVVLVLLVIALNMPTAYVEQERIQQKPQTETTQETRKVVKERKERAKEVAEQAKKERGPFWEMVLKVLLFVMRVVIVVLFVLAIVGIVYLIIRKFLSVKIPAFAPVQKEKRRVEGGDEYIPLQPRTREKAVFPSDNNGVIRKRFYQYIRKGAKGRVDVSLTPKELAKQYGTREESILVTLYEKARYSGKMCRDEEVEQIREEKF